jgi:hypothetical protein
MRVLLVHNEELNDLCCSPTIMRAGDKIEKNEMGGACSAYGGRGVYRVLVGKPEGKKPLGRPRRRWEDNIKVDLHIIGPVTGFPSECIVANHLHSTLSIYANLGYIQCQIFEKVFHTFN